MSASVTSSTRWLAAITETVPEAAMAIVGEPVADCDVAAVAAASRAAEPVLHEETRVGELCAPCMPTACPWCSLGGPQEPHNYTWLFKLYKAAIAVAIPDNPDWTMHEACSACVGAFQTGLQILAHRGMVPPEGEKVPAIITMGEASGIPRTPPFPVGTCNATFNRWIEMHPRAPHRIDRDGGAAGSGASGSSAAAAAVDESTELQQGTGQGSTASKYKKRKQGSRPSLKPTKRPPWPRRP